MAQPWNPMSKDEGGGGMVGRIWRGHGSGFYALLAVGTFVYLEIQSFTESFVSSDGVGEFVQAELAEKLFTFGVETLFNSFMAGIWPFIWIRDLGWEWTLAIAGGGYAVWALLIAWALARREKAYRKELGL